MTIILALIFSAAISWLFNKACSDFFIAQGLLDQSDVKEAFWLMFLVVFVPIAGVLCILVSLKP